MGDGSQLSEGQADRHTAPVLYSTKEVHKI